MRTFGIFSSCARDRLRGALVGSVLCSAVQATSLQFTLTPVTQNKQFGSASVLVGDINADGVPDIAISDPSYAPTSTQFATGIVYIVSGSDGALLRTHEGDGTDAQFFGASLAALDANGDGITDLAVGVPGHNGNDGAVRVYSGVDGSQFSIGLGPFDSYYGAAVVNAGDQNGDGKDDLFVGAPRGNNNKGRVLIQSGDGATVGFSYYTSPFANVGFGESIVALDDLDGDGYNDLAVSSPGVRAPVSPIYSSVGNVSIFRTLYSHNVTERFGTISGNRLGKTMAPAPDSNGDGYADLLVGSNNGGKALLLSGTDLSLIREITVPTLTVHQAVNVGGMLDYDEDGVPDILLGSPYLNQAVTPQTGGSRIVSGVDGSTLFEVTTTVEHSGLGTVQIPLPGYGFMLGEQNLPNVITGGTGFAHFYYNAP